ncbi:MAG: hypothetical protein ACYC9L_00155 [Sulfuricaulis sp.]
MAWRLFVWLLLGWPILVAAADPLTPEDSGELLDFSLRFASAEAPLDYGNQTYDTTSRWIGVSWREKTSEHVTLGIYGGYAYVTQTNNPTTAGIQLDGYHAGFSLHGDVLSSQRASLFYSVAYTYQKADHKSDTQTVVMELSEPQVQLGATIAFTKRFRLYGGGSYGYIDGQERASGTINHTTDIRRASHAGGFLGLDWNVEPDGYVGVEASAGLTRGGELYFRRHY